MKIIFENWFRREIDNKQYMYALDFLPSIGLIYEPKFYSFTISFLFWTLTFESNNKN